MSQCECANGFQYLPKNDVARDTNPQHKTREQKKNETAENFGAKVYECDGTWCGFIAVVGVK